MSSDTEIRRAVCTHLINTLIIDHHKKLITFDDLGVIISLVAEAVSTGSASPFVAAIKYLREATRTEEPILWNTDIEQHGPNELCKTIETYGMHETGTFKTAPGLGLKAAVDICKFIRVNINLLTELLTEQP